MGKSQNNKKVLFLVPSQNSKGGVSNYYKVIKDSITFPFEYFYRGVRIQDSAVNRLFSVFIIPFDYLRFYIKLKRNKYCVVILNTSLGKTGIIRDSFFIQILKFCRVRFIVFFRGIDYKIFEYVKQKWLKLFFNTFLQADKIIVLSYDFKNALVKLGYPNDIIVETTVVDTNLVADLLIEKIAEKQKSKNQKILFLSRLEKSKGIYELINAFRVINKKYEETTLHICGTGSEQDFIKKYITNDRNIHLIGFVTEDLKKAEYLNSHLFILPSYHEGLPNCILEAMAFGLPVITTKVGGIPDIFEHGINGILLEKVEEQKIVEAIEYLLQNDNLRIKIATNNFQYASKYFYKEIVIDRLSKIIEEFRK